jgi:hypothetical protein
MTKFKNSDSKLDDVALDGVVGGAMEEVLSPQLALAAHAVGGWTFTDVFAKPAPFTYRH